MPFAGIETSGIATAIGGSVLLTGLLSGVHLLGLTLLVGAVLVSSLRLMGLVLRREPVADVTAAARRGIVLGFAVSLVSGLLLLSPRISRVGPIFQLKMLLLCGAVAFHLTVYRHAAAGTGRHRLPQPVVGVLGMMLWSAVVAAGCAFILVE